MAKINHVNCTCAEDTHACAEYRELSRRAFLRRGPIEVAGRYMPVAWLPGVALGGAKRGGQQPDILVSCFRRGGADYLSQLVPYADPFLYAAPYNSGAAFFPNGLRPVGGINIGINPPKPSDPDPDALRCVHLGETGGDVFGINKAYLDREFAGVSDRNTLMDLYNSGDVAFVSAAGSPDTNRSHFEAEAFIEFGTPNQVHDELTGWLSRYLAVAPSLGSPMRAAALASDRLIPKQLAFAEKTIAFNAISEVHLPGNAATMAQRAAILVERFAEQTQQPLAGSVLDAVDTADLLSQVQISPHPNAKYTNSNFAMRLLHAAAIIKAGVPVEAIYVDRTGWDNHVYLGPNRIDPENGQATGGGMWNRIKDFSQNIAAFAVDLQDFWHRVVIFDMSEFGRQINMNATWGTDHANGGLIVVAGGAVNGGVFCKRSLGGADGWPGLDPALTIDHDGIRTTIDYRAVLAEILRKRMHVDPQVVSDFIFSTQAEQPPPALDELGVVSE